MDMAVAGSLVGNPLAYSRAVSGKLRRQSGTVDTGLRAIGGDWSQTAYGVGMDITVKISREATYIDEDGGVHSAFQENLVLLLAEAYYDLGEQIAKPGDGGRMTNNDRSPIANRKSQIVNPQSHVQERALAEPPARFPDLELRALEPQLGLRERVSAHWPLPATTLPQRVVALVNKLVRRYLRWYINPIVEQQNAANAATTVALLALIRLDAERRAQVAALRADKLSVKS